MRSNKPLTYRLLIWVERALQLHVGALGRHLLGPGLYVYTGSARRNPRARLQRHLRRDKRLRWHIDYLLSQPEVQVLDVEIWIAPECSVNRDTGGTVPIAGFGASDCVAGCASHLRYLGATPWGGTLSKR